MTQFLSIWMGPRGGMVVEFITTCAIRAHHH